MVNMRLLLIIFILSIFSLSGYGFSVELEQYQGTHPGTGTFFNITAGSGHITASTDNEVSATLFGASDQVIFSISDSVNLLTQVTVRGLNASTNYYVRANGSETSALMATDSQGKISLTLDTSRPSDLFISATTSTVFISDNAVGGGCIAVGNWNDTTNTCTLNQSVADQITLNLSNAVLDCAGYNVTSKNNFLGIVATNNNLSILNCRISGFFLNVLTGFNTHFTLNNSYLGNSSFAGMLFRANNSVVFNNTFANNSRAGRFDTGSNNVFSFNTIINNAFGISSFGLKDSLYLNNTFISGGENSFPAGLSKGNALGLVLGSTNITLRNNTVIDHNGINFRDIFDQDVDTSNTIDGQLAYYLKNLNDTVINDTTHPNAAFIFCDVCNNVTIENIDITSSNVFGIGLNNGVNVTIRRSLVTNNSDGFYIEDSHHLTLHNNTFALREQELFYRAIHAVNVTNSSIADSNFSTGDNVSGSRMVELGIGGSNANIVTRNRVSNGNGEFVRGCSSTTNVTHNVLINISNGISLSGGSSCPKSGLGLTAYNYMVSNRNLINPFLNEEDDKALHTSNGHNFLFHNNTMIGIYEQMIKVESNSYNINFTNNLMIATNNINNYSIRTLENNQDPNITFINNTFVNTTHFIDVLNASSTFINTTYRFPQGVVSFNSTFLTAPGQVNTSNFNITSDGRVFVNTTQIPFFNASAVVTVNALPTTFSNPKVQVDHDFDDIYDECPLCDLLSYTGGGPVTYTVPGFSIYRVVENFTCGTVNRSITLNSNLTGSGSCLNITQDDIVIDCAGSSINGSGAVISVDNKSNVTFKNCQVNVDSADTGVKVVNSTGVILENITFAGGGNGTGFYFENSSTTMLQSTLFDVGIWLVQNSSVTNFTDLTFANPFGNITFFSPLLFNNSLVIDTDLLSITSKIAFINSTNLTMLNTSAQIGFNSLSFINPRPTADFAQAGTFVTCLPPTCVELAYSDGVFVFTVNRFSSFSFEEAFSSVATARGGGGGGGGSSRTPWNTPNTPSSTTDSTPTEADPSERSSTQTEEEQVEKQEQREQIIDPVIEEPSIPSVIPKVFTSSPPVKNNLPLALILAAILGISLLLYGYRTNGEFRSAVRKQKKKALKLAKHISKQVKGLK